MRVVPSDAGVHLQYMCHLQDIGDTKWLSEGQWCGTKGQSRRLEGLAVRLVGPNAKGLQVAYRCHTQDNAGPSWWLADGEFCGTRGKSKRLEAFTIEIGPPRKDTGGE
jgi:uncharacterized protein YjdB